VPPFTIHRRIPICCRQASTPWGARLGSGQQARKPDHVRPKVSRICLDEFTLAVIYSPMELRMCCGGDAPREDQVQALAMGGYGGYVWAAFGFTLISMIGLLWQSWRAQQHRAEELASLRSTVRGGACGRADQPDDAPTRRLVATKPRGSNTVTQPDRPVEQVAADSHGFAPSRPPSGT
jgi:heme exporter protein CcmD